MSLRDPTVPPFLLNRIFVMIKERGDRVDKKSFLKFGVAIVVVFLLGVFLKLAKSVLIPFSLAFLFSFAVSTVLDFLVRRKVPKYVALILILLVIFAAFYLVGTVFYAGGKSLAAELSSYTDVVKSLVEKIDRIVSNPHLRARSDGLGQLL